MRGLGTDHVISATATEYRPANSPIMLCLANICLLAREKKTLQKLRKIKKNVSLHGNIMRTKFDQKSLRPPEEGVLNCHRHTDRHMGRHTDIATRRLNRP